MAFEILSTTTRQELSQLQQAISCNQGKLPVLIHPFFTVYNTRNPGRTLSYEKFRSQLVSSLFDASYFRKLLRYLQTLSGPVLIGEEYDRHAYTLGFLNYINPQLSVISYKTADAHSIPEDYHPSTVSRAIEAIGVTNLVIGGQLLILNSTQSYAQEPRYLVEGQHYGRYGLGGCVGSFLNDCVDAHLHPGISLEISPFVTIRYRET